MGKKGAELRQRAKSVATDMLVIQGYNGFSFNLLAEQIGTTSANLHYHFKNKMTLVEEVLDDYATDTAARFRAIWIDDSLDFAGKVHRTFEFNRERFQKFNNRKTYGRPWSLIARMRTDQEVLSQAAVDHLRAFYEGLRNDVRVGVEMCIARGQLRAETPIEDVVLQLTSIVLSAGPITQDAGNIARLEALYEAFLTTVLEAYGPK